MDANWSSTGLTNDVAASKFGFMAANNISMWRTGRTAVPLSRLPKIAELLRVDMVSLFVLWLRQYKARNDSAPSILIEVLERRLMSANEAEVIKTLRHATRNSDPAFSTSALGAIARAATGV
jgi:transcriptional regulator with XRE-family HTH domain